MIWVAVAVNVAGLAGIVWWVASTPLPRWPTREEMQAARPHECIHCRVAYTQAWQLDDHNTFHHPRPDVEAAKNGVTVLKGYRLGGGS